MRRVLYIILIIFSIGTITGCDNLKKLVNPNIDSTPNDISDNIKDPTKDEDAGESEDDSKDESNDKTEDKTDNSNTKFTISDYYPFKENTKYTYEGKGNEYAAYTSFVDYIKDSRIQLRVNNGGTEVIKVLENKNGELKQLLSREESYYREDLTSKSDEKSTQILLKEPLAKGTSWTLADGSKRYISNIDSAITTPSGSYKALEVTTEYKDSKTLDYYALNVGLVKTIFKSNDMEVTSSLSKIESKAKLVQSVKFYYPNINDGKLYYIKKDLSFNTNDMTKLTFQKVFKESPSKNLGVLLGPNAKINSLYLGKDNMVYVDFSKELVTEMNAGAEFEAMILQSITNTLGEYYGVTKVYITVENSPYSSGHILKKKGEYFTVNTKNSVALKSSAN
jgi:hypothetical protein